MSYKVKSLLYFICFIASALFYYYLDIDNEQPTPIQSAEIPIKEKDTITPNERISEAYKASEEPQFSEF
ncbi:MAG: hypothetical protein R3243_09465 [Arenibacter latericius]|nr:hypothetical protein [Arenibacter latericius]